MEALRKVVVWCHLADTSPEATLLGADVGQGTGTIHIFAIAFDAIVLVA